MKEISPVGEENFTPPGEENYPYRNNNIKNNIKNNNIEIQSDTLNTIENNLPTTSTNRQINYIQDKLTNYSDDREYIDYILTLPCQLAIDKLIDIDDDAICKVTPNDLDVIRKQVTTIDQCQQMSDFQKRWQMLLTDRGYDINTVLSA